MQSLHVVRFLLNLVAFVLALRASSRHAWSVVEPPGWTTLDASSINKTATSSDLFQLTLSPNNYCLDAINGSSDCHPYAYLLTQSVDHATLLFNLTNPAAVGLAEDLLASTTSNRLEAATSSWCIASSSSSANDSGSWLLQGAQSMLCLVVLETCLYSAVLWHLVGFGSVLCAFMTALKYPAFESSSGFMTLAQAALGTLVLVEWAGYSMYMMDWGYVAVLQLVVRYGASFRLAIVSALFSLVSTRISSKISSPFSTIYLAKLHALPPSPRSTSNRRRWSPQNGTPRPESPEVEDEDSTLDCLEQAIDPLKCPANYRT